MTVQEEREELSHERNWKAERKGGGREDDKKRSTRIWHGVWEKRSYGELVMKTKTKYNRNRHIWVGVEIASEQGGEERGTGRCWLWCPSWGVKTWWPTCQAHSSQSNAFQVHYVPGLSLCIPRRGEFISSSSHFHNHKILHSEHLSRTLVSVNSNVNLLDERARANAEVSANEEASKSVGPKTTSILKNIYHTLLWQFWLI